MAAAANKRLHIKFLFYSSHSVFKIGTIFKLIIKGMMCLMMAMITFLNLPKGKPMFTFLNLPKGKPMFTFMLQKPIQNDFTFILFFYP